MATREAAGDAVTAIYAALEEQAALCRELLALGTAAGERADAMAEECESLLSGVEIVAAGAEQISWGIDSISEQVVAATEATEHAVDRASAASSTMAEFERSGENTVGIGDILNSVTTDIAALSNAATAQARGAGEAVRGFAAVSTAMKQFAQETRSGADEIRDALGSGRNEAESRDFRQKIANAASRIERTAIAGQMFSLNAAIEAARAEAAGQEFEAITEQINALSQRSKSAAGGITGQLECVTARAIEAIQALRTEIERIDNTSAAIRSAVEEQAAVKANMQSVLDTTGKSMQSLSDGVTATKAAAASIAGLAARAATNAAAVRAAFDRLHPGRVED